MRVKSRNIIVIGCSARRAPALDALVSHLPNDTPSAIFIVQHMSPQNTRSAFLHRLGKHRAFHCTLATDGKNFSSR
jgi:chemotaxis response regulator CheB